MAQCHRHHPQQYYRDEYKPVEAAAYSDTIYASDGRRSFAENRTFVVEEPPRDYVREEKQYTNRERLGEVGAVAAGAFALYEANKAKKDPEHARKHKIEERIAAAAAVGSGGYAFYEHHEKKEAKEEEKYQQYY